MKQRCDDGIPCPYTCSGSCVRWRRPSPDRWGVEDRVRVRVRLPCGHCKKGIYNDRRAGTAKCPHCNGRGSRVIEVEGTILGGVR